MGTQYACVLLWREGRKDEKKERYVKLISFGKNITNVNPFFKADVKEYKHLKQKNITVTCTELTPWKFQSETIL